jgi:hypothetical protein
VLIVNKTWRQEVDQDIHHNHLELGVLGEILHVQGEVKHHNPWICQEEEEAIHQPHQELELLGEQGLDKMMTSPQKFSVMEGLQGGLRVVTPYLFATQT